jgi:hypothetical protein
MVPDPTIQAVQNPIKLFVQDAEKSSFFESLISLQKTVMSGMVQKIMPFLDYPNLKTLGPLQ